MAEGQPSQTPSQDGTSAEEVADAVELVLFHVNECYVYLIPPRKSAASYSAMGDLVSYVKQQHGDYIVDFWRMMKRADEWDVNKWAWEGSLKVVSKGEECIIKLEDKNTGDLYARAFLRKGEPHPVEPVIDSSRYFVLRIEENIAGRLRHAFIGIGFRERPQAYDFQAALHDHMKYLDKKKTAEEMEQHFQSTPSVDYSLKEGETLVLQIKNKGNRSPKSTIYEQDIGNLSLEENSKSTLATVSLKPPPPPPAAVSCVDAIQVSNSTVDIQSKEPPSGDTSETDTVEDDFGDFQAAG